MKKVYVRCKKCGTLLLVDYDGKEVFCSACNEKLLSDNDERISDDYVEMIDGKPNIIGGDGIDKIIDKIDEDQLDEWFGRLMDEEDEDHLDELKKDAVDIKKSSVGDNVFFGNMMWVVLDIEGEKRLLLFKECVGFDFDYQYEENTGYDEDLEFEYHWEKGLCRKYLNTYFLDKFIPAEERKRIIHNKSNYRFIDGKNEMIEDKVFLLSKEEVEKYLPLPKDRVAKKHVMFNDVARPWFLRLDDESKKNCPYVSTNGEFDIIPDECVIEWFRPAIWIK